MFLILVAFALAGWASYEGAWDIANTIQVEPIILLEALGACRVGINWGEVLVPVLGKTKSVEIANVFIAARRVVRRVIWIHRVRFDLSASQ